MTIKYTLQSFILIAGLSSGAAKTDPIDRLLQSKMTEESIPGLQIAVVKDGEIVKASSYGIANIQDSIAVDNETVFTLNSITKAFTGVAIMQLVEQGAIDLAKPISIYLADLPQTWQAITVKQLLTHTSGLPDIMNSNNAKLISSDGMEESWQLVQQRPLDFEVSTQFRYNQTNYLLLGKIIAIVSGDSFAAYITRNQLRPTGMKRTEEAGFAHVEGVVAHSARGYTYFKTGELTTVHEEFPPPLRTAAGMSATATDLANWLIALQSGKLLTKPSSLKTLWSPGILRSGKMAGFGELLNGYALGWPVIDRPEHPAVAPIGGGRVALLVYPEDKLSVIVLTNLQGAFPERFIDDIAAYYLNDMTIMPKP